jgi:hypothetical protein
MDDQDLVLKPMLTWGPPWLKNPPILFKIWRRVFFNVFHHQVDQFSNEITQIRKGRYTKKMYPVLWATKKLGTSKFRMWLADGISWTHRSTLGIDFGTNFSSTPTPKLHC